MMSFIEFDGFCPECKLKGELVEMRLNENDFWESVKTHLQITIFPPYAAILKWRGNGKFKKLKTIASKKIKGLILAKTQSVTGCEIFPDTKNVIMNSKHLKTYLNSISES
ncbi:MAG: hypothetical protein ACRDE5_16315 [Ginsengibacter sp.]